MTLHLHQRRLRLKYSYALISVTISCLTYYLQFALYFQNLKLLLFGVCQSFWGLVSGSIVRFRSQTSRQNFRELLLKHGRSLMVRALQLVLLFSMKPFTFVRNFYRRNIMNTDLQFSHTSRFLTVSGRFGNLERARRRDRHGNVEH